MGKLFRESKKSPIDLVNCNHFNNVLEAELIVRELKELGYMIGLNLMQSHGKSEQEYINVAKTIYSWKIIDVLYFADSLGNMTPDNVKFICDALRKGWSGPLGIHTHNNKELALINSITALKNGVTWCDGTITGMGRGAGNASTEGLLLEMSQLNYHQGNANLIQPAIEDFSALKNKYKWGANFYYHYASNHGIHPTFVQSLLEDTRYDNQQVLGALEFLADRDSTSYSSDGIREAIYGNQIDVVGKWDATGWLAKGFNCDFSSSVQKYKEGILQHIKRANIEVFFLNVNRYYLLH